MQFSIVALSDSRRLQQHLIERRILTLRKLGDVAAIEHELTGPGLRRHGVARLVEPFGDDLDGPEAHFWRCSRAQHLRACIVACLGAVSNARDAKAECCQ